MSLYKIHVSLLLCLSKNINPINSRSALARGSAEETRQLKTLLSTFSPVAEDGRSNLTPHQADRRWKGWIPHALQLVVFSQMLTLLVMS